VIFEDKDIIHKCKFVDYPFSDKVPLKVSFDIEIYKLHRQIVIKTPLYIKATKEKSSKLIFFSIRGIPSKTDILGLQHKHAILDR
jgi:hypothetical protein